MSKPTVLVIDDDINYLELLAEALEGTFQVSIAATLTQAESIIKDHHVFDIALVDENIGEEKGSAWIKNHTASGNVARSFVLYSGLATEEAILKGLECGADDFLAKPISLLALTNKLEKLITYQQQISRFEHEISSKEHVINVSMAQASKYGACMQLTSRLNSCFSIEKIRDEIFSFFYTMSLKGCIAFYPLNKEAEYFNSTNGFCSPVEKSVMELLKIKPRLHRFGNRTIFNHPLVSILVLNLEEDSIDTDIYVDAFASVIECVGARMEFLIYKESLINVQEQIQQAVSKTKKMIQVSKHHNQEVMNEIVQSIGLSFHVLDMTIEQEEYLTDLVHNALKKHTQDDVNFFEVTNLLDGALEKVDELKALNRSEEEEEVHNEFNDEDVLF
ncbi:response regulator [Thalassotalea hakodatensis]|uniref:response regulator n=1 Tax=Thalassotalea hakodatensis TaxID=3030492 RepID=UPI0025736F49|nr:response regulator [Thalassotalea hakodatensis]